MLKKTYDWLGAKVNSRYADPLLCVLFYLEAIFLIPVDPILILYCVHNRKKSLYYAAIATISSVAGGATAYYLGYYLWINFGEQILNFKLVSYVLSKEMFFALKNLYIKYANWAILIAGFTPIPYKAATLSAGFCQLPFAPFIFFSFLARGARFFLVAITIRIFGEKIKNFIDKYFNTLSIIFMLIIILIILYAKSELFTNKFV